MARASSGGATAACVMARPKWKSVERGGTDGADPPAPCDPTPANPQHIETRPRLMCYSFHVEEREGPRSGDLVEKRQGGWGGERRSIRRFNNVN